MTISECIHDYLVEHRPAGFCDDCLQRKLGLGSQAGGCSRYKDARTDAWFPTGIRPLSLLLAAA